MIEETGVVIAAHGELAEVECRRQSTCSACGVSGSCGTSLLERYFGRRTPVLTVQNAIGAHAGDSVVIGVPEAGLLSAALAAYLVPLLALIGGAMLAGWSGGLAALGPRGALELIGAAAGLAAGLLWVRRFGRSHREDPRYRPVILRRSGIRVARVELRLDTGERA